MKQFNKATQKRFHFQTKRMFRPKCSLGKPLKIEAICLPNRQIIVALDVQFAKKIIWQFNFPYKPIHIIQDEMLST